VGSAPDLVRDRARGRATELRVPSAVIGVSRFFKALVNRRLVLCPKP